VDASSDDDGIVPVSGGLPAREAGLAYLRAGRAAGARRPSKAPAGDADTEPGTPGGLDGMVPVAGPMFALALMLAALRPDARTWLGTERLRRSAAALGDSEAALLRLLDAAPRPPLSLGDPLPWGGRRVPLLQDGAVTWVDLFWRPDRDTQRRRIGAFAARLTIPPAGRLELRGRLEERRLDMVAETECRLPRRIAADAEDAFTRTLRRLELDGTLTLLGGTS
jgi:hypothetical protein